MDAAAVLTDMASRPLDSLGYLPQLSVEQANTHLADHPNSVAWLLWHTGRMADVQLAQLTGEPEAWETHRLPDLDRAGIGYGDSDEQARAVQVTDAAELAALVDYVRATLTALRDYAGSLTESQLDDVIDTTWTPHVTRGVRIISIIDDAAVHLGQIAFITGAPGA